MPRRDISGAPTPPTQFPSGVPESGATQNFIFQSVFELTQSFARVEEKIDALKERVNKLDGSVNELEHTVSKVRGGILVAGIFFTLVLAVLGWIVAGDVKFSAGGETAALAPVQVPQTGKAAS